MQVDWIEQSQTLSLCFWNKSVFQSGIPAWFEWGDLHSFPEDHNPMIYFIIYTRKLSKWIAHLSSEPKSVALICWAMRAWRDNRESDSGYKIDNLVWYHFTIIPNLSDENWTHFLRATAECITIMLQREIYLPEEIINVLGLESTPNIESV